MSTDQGAQENDPRPEPERQRRPVTGDAEVDRVLSDLDQGLLGDGEAQLEALTQAHRSLQGRLSDPSEQAVPPGQARPGPR